MNPLVSVIIPVFNIESYLDKCILSVLNQSYINIDIILIDDGSTDSSPAICDAYKSKDSRIRVVHKSNGGLVSARKAGMAIANGEYIVNVDGDDYIDEKFIEVLVKAAMKTNADVVESGYITYSKNSNAQNKVFAAEYNCANNDVKLDIIRDWLKNPAYSKIHSTIWSKIYKTNLFKQVYTNVPDDMQFGEDWVSFIYLIANVNKITSLDVCLYYYLDRNDSLSHYSVRKLKWYRNALCLYTTVIKLIEKLFPTMLQSDLNLFFVSLTSNFLDFNKKEIRYTFPHISTLFGKKVLLYGAGNVGQSFYRQLSLYEQIDIVSWVDKNPEKYSFDYYKVRTIDNSLLLDFDYIIVAVLKKSLYTKIKDFLLDRNIPENKIIWIEQPIEKNETVPKYVGYNIVQVIGGLGNQMFQYAFYRALFEQNKTTKINIDAFEGYKRPFELKKVFPNVKLEYDNLRDFETYKNPISLHDLYIENGACRFDRNALTKMDTSFIGYWQTEKYFKSIEDVIRKDFIFNIADKTLDTIGHSIMQDCKSVALHVRRGDYMDTPDIYGGICTVDYYKRAIKKISGVVSNPHFFVFSDDLEWVKERLVIPNAVFISKSMFTHYENWYDMYLMSCCKHNIIANSSFSWWGAWLNHNSEKIVIAPKSWQNGVETPDIWCDGWIRL